MWRRGQALDEPFVLSSAVPISNEAPHISDSLGRLLRGWEEVPADGLYYLDLSSEGRNLCSEAIKIKWGEEGLVSPVSEMNTDVPTETIISQSTEPLILRFLSTFEASVGPVGPRSWLAVNILRHSDSRLVFSVGPRPSK